jgi:hypothetical protein
LNCKIKIVVEFIYLVLHGITWFDIVLQTVKYLVSERLNGCHFYLELLKHQIVLLVVEIEGQAIILDVDEHDLVLSKLLSHFTALKIELYLSKKKMLLFDTVIEMGFY